MYIRLLPALILAGLSTASANDADEVRCREIGFSQAAERQDLAAFSRFIDADARFVGATVLRGVDDITAAWAVFFQDDGPVIRWRPRVSRKRWLAAPR